MEKESQILDRLIAILCAERGEPVPDLAEGRKPDFFRALCNVRPPAPVTEEFLRLEEKYLSERREERGVVDVNGFRYAEGTALWQGDITRLNADAIVNACNPALLGCFHPLHACIDNVIHSNAGVQVRLDCAEMMKGGTEPNGCVRVTKAYHLPCRYIFHTVGPITDGRPSERDREDLRNCYLSCLNKAEEMRLSTIAFCCISTGEYRYPREEACCTAVGAVREWRSRAERNLKVIFDVFTEEDRRIYERELGRASL